MSLEDYDKTWQLVDTRSDVEALQDAGTDTETVSKAKVDENKTSGDDAQSKSPDETTNELPGDGEEDEDEECLDRTIPQILAVTEMESRNGQSIVTKSRRFRRPKAKKDKFEDYAGVLRRKLDESGLPLSTILEVKSPLLRNALKEVLKDFERINLDADPIAIPKPYESLFYRENEIKAYRKLVKSAAAEKELDVLLEFMNLNLQEVRKEYDSHVKNGKIKNSIAWALFPPGEVIVMNVASNAPAQCFLVKDCRFIGPLMLNIKVTMFEYNGRTFGNVKKNIQLQLPQNAGSYEITDLFVYPLKFHPDCDKLKKSLVDRGRKYAKIVRRTHMNYKSVYLASALLL
jgi:hypothetical protein